MTLKNIFGKWKRAKNLIQQQILTGAEEGDGLSGNLNKDEQVIFQGLSGSSDIIRRRILIGSTPAVLIYIEGIIDNDVIHKDVLNRLQRVKEIPSMTVGALDFIAQKVLSTSTVKKTTLLANMLVEVLTGNAVLLIEGNKQVLIVEVKGGERRNITEPVTERTMRGSREGFIEDIAVNLALVRRKIVSTKLAIEVTRIGQRSRTKVALAYMSDIADPKIVQEVRHRISQINTDVILEAGYIERFIEDHPWSLFPQVFGTERPDRVVANLLEGRVAILIDGTPYVLVVPTLFIQFLQGSEDYNERLIVGSLARTTRYFAFLLTTTLTAIYIALVTFHHSLLPTDLLLAVAEARQKVPFSALAEAMFMEIVVEILREAGLRLPQTVGQTLGVVGGIVLGQAVIQANLVSPLMVVVVALSAISSFVFPNYSMALAIRLIKFPLMILASIFGALGIAVGWVFFTIHLASMESFGIPYLAPLAPTRYADLGDTMVVSNLWKHKKRPASIPHVNNRRMGDTPQE
ncbi:GerA spore germination protein [Desulforamulus reducens MI-1]|uniref:GerA spore germination protein n=1 Tax=Desulforamulus reducens (strain ATCC BAA-1160 / DSM 100696 / MI-1) TaxID=349161 RepID=A4J7W6_DESRM|nr:spore germination protein [Desulforamulus reducens]ABO51169.1 GerA spore germination protein [Desulforamulus reducens MI-1]